MKPAGLGKRNKLCSAVAIDRLFGNGEGIRSAIAYPLRAVWNTDPVRRDDSITPKFLISIPKKRLRHAVDRVTMRRRVREAYRLTRRRFTDNAATAVDIAFIYVANELRPYASVEKSMVRLLSTIFPTTSSGNETSPSDQPGD